MTMPLTLVVASWPLSAFSRHVLNRQLGAVALLNQEEQRTEMDTVFNDGACAAGLTSPCLTIHIPSVGELWRCNQSCIVRGVCSHTCKR